MIIFEFDTDIICDSGRITYWITCTSVTAEDKKHTEEIYEQLDAELGYNL